MTREIMEEKTAAFAEGLLNGWKEFVGDIPEGADMNALTDATEDFTAILVAMHYLYETMTGDEDEDLVGFTHILNRLAIQFTMEMCDWDDWDEEPEE